MMETAGLITAQGMKDFCKKDSLNQYPIEIVMGWVTLGEIAKAEFLKCKKKIDGK